MSVTRSQARYIRKQRVFMGVAHQIAQLGTCDRAKVGAVIVRDGRCISWGYNGSAPGLPHCDENDHGWNGATTFKHNLGEDPLVILSSEAEGCRNATHAEANALAFAARQGISTEGGTMYLTVSPCAICSRLIIAAGIERVYFTTEYRDLEGIDLLEVAGVKWGVVLPGD